MIVYKFNRLQRFRNAVKVSYIDQIVKQKIRNHQGHRGTLLCQVKGKRDQLFFCFSLIFWNENVCLSIWIAEYWLIMIIKIYFFVKTDYVNFHFYRPTSKLKYLPQIHKKGKNSKNLKYLIRDWKILKPKIMKLIFKYSWNFCQFFQ